METLHAAFSRSSCPTKGLGFPILSRVVLCIETSQDKSWAGREWYVVKKAEVRLAQDRDIPGACKVRV